jgi:hypothetical protein
MQLTDGVQPQVQHRNKEQSAHLPPRCRRASVAHCDMSRARPAHHNARTSACDWVLAITPCVVSTINNNKLSVCARGMLLNAAALTPGLKCQHCTSVDCTVRYSASPARTPACAHARTRPWHRHTHITSWQANANAHTPHRHSRIVPQALVMNPRMAVVVQSLDGTALCATSIVEMQHCMA